MTTALFTHPACLRHVTPHGHPERSARLEAVLTALSGTEFNALDRREAPRATEGELSLAHPADFVRAVLDAIPATGMVSLDADTTVSPGSGEAALRASGAVVHAIDAVMAGEVRNAFCAVRPPGHHAEPRRPMGFCIFNSVAVGAHHARMVHGLQRVAVVDFDVHHGNGTQAMFEAEPALFYGSTHQMPLYPGTGAADERGIAGNIVNAPLAPGAGGAQFRKAFRAVLDGLERFEPEFIIVSAGFDAHADDPLANLNLVEDDFAWATDNLVSIAKAHCGGRLVSALEGGYDLNALGSSARAHVRALMAGQ